MTDLNDFAFTGHCTRDAQVKEIKGKMLMEVDIANNIGYGDYAKTNWLKVKMWGERCNNIVDIFKKGVLVTGHGELTINEWTSNNNGEKHTDIVVTVMELKVLSSKPRNSSNETEETQSDTIATF